MSSGIDTEKPVTAPVADLSAIDLALAGGDEGLREAVRKVRPADLGHDLSRRSSEDSRRIFEVIDDRRAALMLRAAHPTVAAELLARVTAVRAVHVLAFMATDHQVAILAEMKAAARASVEAAMDPGDRDTVKRLLAYDAVAVGRLMTPKIWRAGAAQTAGEALAILARDREEIEVAVNLYVVDGGRPIGVVPLREVSIAAADRPLRELMTPDPIVVREDTPRGDAAAIIRTHDFLSLPVVDPTGTLIGAVRVDDLLDAVLDRVGDAMLNQGAVASGAARTPYFRTSLAHTVRSRLTWLILLFVAETATGTVLRYFEDELARVVALSFFIPLLIGTGGNAGSQTVSTIIRALAVGEVRTRDVVRVVLREVSAGVLLGILLGTIAFGRALLWGVSYDLAFCVATTILVVCTWANAVGAAIPLVAQRVGIDPTVISAPLITTLVDASGLFIYFTVAHLMIAQLHTPTVDTGAPYTCAVVEVHQPDARESAPLPRCDPDADKPATPCWRFAEPAGESTPKTPAFALVVDRGGAAAPAGVVVRASCTDRRLP